MHKNNDTERPAMPDYETMYNEAVEYGRKMCGELEDLRAKCRALEVESMKYKTIIATMEFLLGRKLDA